MNKNDFNIQAPQYREVCNYILKIDIVDDTAINRDDKDMVAEEGNIF